MIGECKKCIKRNERVLITTLTKRMAEELDKLVTTDKRFARAANLLTSDKDLENIQPYIFTNETSFFLQEFI